MDIIDFPAFQEREGGTEIVIPAGRLAEIVGKVSFSAAKEGSRPALTGVLIDTGDALRMTACDGFRLATDVLDIKAEPATAIVPASSLLNIAKAIQGETTLSIGESRIWLSSEGVAASLQIIEGKYPEWERLVPETGTTKFVVEADALGDALKVAGLFTDNKGGHVNLVVSETEAVASPGRVAVSASSSQSGDGIGTVDAVVEGPGLEFSINAAYLRDIINALGGKLVFEMTTPSAPMKMHKDGDMAVYVVMPVFIAKAPPIVEKKEVVAVDEKVGAEIEPEPA